MGALTNFFVLKYIEKYKTRVFVETGAAEGFSLKYAQRFNFLNLFSVEIDSDRVQQLNVGCCKDIRTAIFGGQSFDFLEMILPKIKENILFWLDAHIPHNIPYSPESRETCFPLERELEIIYALRFNYKDVILIDDLRIYERGNFEAGNMDDAVNCQNYNTYGLGFLNKFYNRYVINKHYNDQGYIELLPKDP